MIENVITSVKNEGEKIDATELNSTPKRAVKAERKLRAKRIIAKLSQDKNETQNPESVLSVDQNSKRKKRSKSKSKNKQDSKIRTKKPACICKICGARLKSFTALGGHTSKAHPKQSKDFAKRMQIREERTLDRQMLEQAKNIFKGLYPGADINLNRNKIAYYKL